MSNITPAQGTRNRIAELATWLIEEPLTDMDAMNQGPHLERFLPISGGSHLGRLYIDKEGVDLYFSALDALEKDRVCEHIDRRTIDEELARLAHDLRQEQQKMKNRNVCEKRLRLFFSEITRPLSTYEFIFRLEGIKKLPSDPFTIGNVAFREFSRELAGINGQCEGIHQKKIEEFIGQPVTIVKAEAGSTEKAVERAREYCERALNTLRFCIGVPHWFWAIQDIELLQRLGEDYLVRQINPETSPLAYGWKRGFRRIDRDISGRSEEEIRLFLERLRPLYDSSIQGKLRDRLLRSIEWISTSITRESHDHKIIDLCTAMESVLTTKDDPKKGEAIAVRSLLLSMTPTQKGDAIPDELIVAVMAPNRWCIPPETIYKLYGKRSEIVHGSSLGICVNSDYTTLRLQAANIVLSIIALVRSEKKITQLKHLFEFLESRERLERGNPSA